MMSAWEPTYKELQAEYRKRYSLGYLNTTIENKFGLISLICFLTKQARKKTPDANCYQVLMKITKERPISEHFDNFIKGLSIVCTDFMEQTTEFMTFDMKTSKEMINKINEVLDTWRPF